MTEAVNLSTLKLHPAVEETLVAYRRAGTPPHGLRLQDYQRWSFVLDAIEADGGDLLDIGIGMGQFVHAAHLSKCFSRIRGADMRAHSGLQFRESFDFITFNLTDPDLSLSAEIVTCMECIEHIESPGFERAVANLKAAATKRLIVTVPYMEDPLPPFHKQHFDGPRLEQLFPSGRLTLMASGKKVHWAMIDWRL